MNERDLELSEARVVAECDTFVRRNAALIGEQLNYELMALPKCTSFASAVLGKAISKHIKQKSFPSIKAPGAKDCVDCGEAIPIKRKTAAPFATRCLECAQSLERRGRLYAT